MRPVLLAGLATGAVLAAAPAADATTFNVSTTADPAGACATPPNGCSLRQALAIVNATPNPPDVINLAPGVYQNTQVAEFPVNKSVSIVGAGSKTTTVLGSSGSRVFNLNGSFTTVSISGVTITGGHAGTGFGGGVNASNDGTLLTLSGVALIGNDATGGGGLNTAGSANFPVMINDSLIANNTASTYGGAGVEFALNQGFGTLRNVTVTKNVATGVASPGFTMAAGIAKLVGTANLIDSTVSDNTGSGTTAGGNLSGTFTIRDSIVANGTSSVAGRENCSAAGAGSPVVNTSQGYNLEDRDQCFPTKGAGDIVDTDPKLGALAPAPDATSTLALLPGSPAINNGNPGLCNDIGLLHDQRQLTRPQGRCDIGAFEFQLPTLAGAPTASGTPAVGSTLACASPAVASSGDGPSTTVATWLRDGATVASGDTYAVAAADAGHAVSCRTTATNAAGSVDASSNGITIPAPAAGGTGGGGGGATGTGAGGSGGTGTTKPAVAKAPKLALSPRSRTLRTILGSGGLLVSAKCDLACGVRITVKYGKKTVATGSRSVAAGKATLVRVKVTKAGKKALHGKKRVKLKITVVATSGKKSTTKTVSYTTAKASR